MKKHILLSLATMMTATCFGIDAVSNVETIQQPNIALNKTLPVSNDTSITKGLLYVRMNATDTNVSQSPEWDNKSFLPGIGIGYRRGAVSAVDISLGTSYREDGEGNRVHSWTFPKMTYLRYLNPHKNSSFYAGAGLAWGGIITKQKDAAAVENPAGLIQMVAPQEKDPFFFGIIPAICVGYETNHRSEHSWRSFIELEVSQPALAVRQQGERPGPIAELSVGLGY